MDDEYRLRTRLAELMSSAGVGHGRIALEVLYLLPEDFIRTYTLLWEKALGPAGGGSGDSGGRSMQSKGELSKAPGKAKERTGSGQRDQIMAARSGAGKKKWGRMGFGVRDEHALNYKTRVDRKLRLISREMDAYLRVGAAALERKEQARCGSCGRIMDDTWVHCPFDGRAIGGMKR